MVMYRIPGYGEVQVDVEGAEGGSLIWIRLRLPPVPGAGYGPPGYPSQDLGVVEPAPRTAQFPRVGDP